MSRPIAATLLGLALAAGVAVPLLPCVPSSGRVGVIRTTIYATGGLVCHQRADRSFAACGRQWPVCARCSGLYLGGAAGALLTLGGLRTNWGWRRWRSGLLVAGLPTALLWSGEMAGLGNPGNVVRFATASLLGVMTAFWLSAVARGDLA